MPSTVTCQFRKQVSLSPGTYWWYPTAQSRLRGELRELTVLPYQRPATATKSQAAPAAPAAPEADLGEDAGDAPGAVANPFITPNIKRGRLAIKQFGKGKTRVTVKCTGKCQDTFRYEIKVTGPKTKVKKSNAKAKTVRATYYRRGVIKQGKKAQNITFTLPKKFRGKKATIRMTAWDASAKTKTVKANAKLEVKPKQVARTTKVKVKA